MTGSPDTRSGEYQKDTCRTLTGELREIGDQLRIVVDAIEENPSSLDREILGTSDRAPSIEAIIVDVYRILKGRVYDPGSSLRVHEDVWEAFKEQEGEFVGFYRSALNALEVYKEVLQAYMFLKHETTPPLPQRGYLQQIRQDERAHKDERNECIETLCDFRDKYSAMLVILSSAD